MLLTGNYRRSMDDKHRIGVPKSFRSKTLDDAPWYFTQGLDGCLAVYPEDAFAALADRMAAASPASRQARDYARLFYSNAVDAAVDRQGRIRIPAALAAWAHLSGEVMVIGVRDHFEIWASDKWEDYVAARESQFDELAEQALDPTSNTNRRESPGPASESIEQSPSQPR